MGCTKGAGQPFLLRETTPPWGQKRKDSSRNGLFFHKKREKVRLCGCLWGENGLYRRKKAKKVRSEKNKMEKNRRKDKK